MWSRMKYISAQKLVTMTNTTPASTTDTDFYYLKYHYYHQFCVFTTLLSITFSILSSISTIIRASNTPYHCQLSLKICIFSCEWRLILPFVGLVAFYNHIYN